MSEPLQVRIHGEASLPALVYLPGMHGDWTLVSSFRAAVAGKVRFVEFTYSRSATASLAEYTESIRDALLARGINEGLLLGESFGSQPAWALIRQFQEYPKCKDRLRPIHDRSDDGRRSDASENEILARETAVNRPDRSDESPECFRPLGLFLAGGFVRHPVVPAVRLVQRISGRVPISAVRRFCIVYALYAKFRHRRAPETLAAIGEFVANRSLEADRIAITHRYGLIAENDLRPVARAATIPVYYLGGLIDPLVPWPFVRRWLRRNCPGYRGGRTFWRADHNVLATAPQTAAGQILEWIHRETSLSFRSNSRANQPVTSQRNGH